MKAWVTGGAGFLGSHVTGALWEQGHTVTVIDDFSTGLAENLDFASGRLELLQMSISDAALRQALQSQQPAMIFHLAGDARVAQSMENPRLDCERNLLSTLALLESVRAASPKSKVLFASSGAVYGDRAERPFSEADPVSPISPYAVAKLAAERYCFAFAHSYGLRTCSLRLFSVYGPRQRKQVVFDLIRKVNADTPVVELFGTGMEERDFSHVGNIVDAFLLAAEMAPFQGEVINVAGDEIVTIRVLAEQICMAMGKHPQLHFSGTRQPGASHRWVANTERLRNMGYRPRLQLAGGLRDTIDWYLRCTQ